MPASLQTPGSGVWPLGLKERVRCAAGPTAPNSAESGVGARRGAADFPARTPSETHPHPQTRGPNVALLFFTLHSKREGTPSSTLSKRPFGGESRSMLFTTPRLIARKLIFGRRSGSSPRATAPALCKTPLRPGRFPRADPRGPEEDLEKRRRVFRSLPAFTVTPFARN